MHALLEFPDPAATETAVSGGKGASLARLTQGGFGVPTGVIVPAESYRAFLATIPGLAELIAALTPEDATRLHAQCADIRTRLTGSPLPPAVDAALRERLPALLAGGRVSVRSSATLEDLVGAAFAGQHDTYLNVADVDDVIDAVRRCFASLWEDRAVRYRHEKGFAPDAAAMAVVIQRMVRSEVAGVAFSMNPITGALDQVVVNAAYGLGETVVSGEGGIDQFVLAKRTGDVIEQSISAKEHALVGGENGTERVAVDAERANASCLSEADLRALADMVRRVERFYAFPQDVEWALAEGDLHLLQSRPVTEFPERWTRDESAERFPSPVTPLTWDFTMDGFHESLTYSLELMGLPPFRGAWFDRFDGYVYGNQTAVQLFTAGQQVSFESMDELRGMRETLVEQYRWVQELPVTWARDLDRYLLALGRLGAVQLPALTDEQVWRQMRDIDALGRAYFLPNIAISITHGILHRTLYRLVHLLAGAEKAPVLYDALNSFSELKTSLVNGDLYRLYRLAVAEPALSSLLRDTDRRRVWDDRLLENYPRFLSAFRRFLDDHGHREVEFDTYVPTWSGQPWVVLENLRLMLMQGDVPDPATREGDLRARQSAAEREFLAAVPEELRNFSAELLRLARAYTALDDLEHYQTTRLNPLSRAAAVELGARLVKRGVLPVAEDVFFLRKRTLQRLMEEGAGDADATAEAAENRAAYEQQRATQPPRVWGQDNAPPPEGALRGLPGSPGAAEGPVCLVHGVEDFARFVPGSVLVARTTNPAWTPLFYSAVAVITESGGPLSHGAVTAREVGIPAVMAVHGALSALRDGEVVRVNGTQGAVSRL
ncbi:PEP/pyruvate-binding domain-containing protein [Longimicrobium terrae]|uniref:Pyruvate,water dikinase n=1 Tax=Longimicrobium terrae TaxID=1639882 RepID=A0A841GXW1_9BACT|nr:PEP/pyruvate-binding domain-containing protein [Longimicrobium terrae]MBB4636183.1 pyruvate,water dikinase [Longimicrobium terrae]MBB6070578.1 pyruvate,water dikinase [Longimicrobium terrae]NNC29564.1 phosphoenolpyruvate synthase [Longimicrobium terrae]